MEAALKTRTLSALLLAPVFLALIYWGPVPFALALALLSFFAGRELAGLLNRLGWPAPRFLPWAGLAVLAGGLAGADSGLRLPLLFLTVGVPLVWLFVPIVPARPRRGAAAWAVHLLGALYAGWLPSLLARLHQGPWRPEGAEPRGSGWVFLAVFLVWAYDTGAYGCGRLLGRHALWREVSPAKTWEGVLGGIALAVVAAALLSGVFAPGLTRGGALLLGALAAASAQLGDLVESRLKRRAGVKDSSEMIPGHGGILDRFDSLFFAAPLFYYYLGGFGR
jgi:phosphatidate cytidylyltransferase